MIVDRENEIKNFKPEPRFAVVLKDENGDEWRSPTVAEQERCDRLKAHLDKLLSEKKLAVGEVKRGKKQEGAPQPFKTGTMQQVAGKLMGMSPTKVMDTAQSLFERHHLITYHRSDSVRVSPETAAEQLKFAKEVWPDLVPDKPVVHKNRNGAQDAHECIHPSYLDAKHAPEKVKHLLNSDEYGLYSLIWGRFHASRAKPAVWDTLEASAVDGNTGKTLPLKLVGAKLVFDGWRRLDPSAPKSRDKTVSVQPVEGTRMGGLVSIDRTFTKPPSPYTTSDLIKDMEKEGVGRPATTANCFETLFSRGYVVEVPSGKIKKLESTELGRNVVSWAERVCPELRNKQYTSKMEEELDLVCIGERNWHKVVVDFHQQVIVPSKERGWAEVNAMPDDGGTWKQAGRATAAKKTKTGSSGGVKKTSSGNAKGAKGVKPKEKKTVSRGGPHLGI